MFCLPCLKSVPNGLVPEISNIADANIVNVTREKANEVSPDVKGITQLYNEYAVPFELWEERWSSGAESVGDEDVARAFLAACKGAPEPVLNTYDQLLSNGVILPSSNLRLSLLRSVLVVIREWAMSVRGFLNTKWRILIGENGR